jgi:AcrR family transcriptional regulator
VAQYLKADVRKNIATAAARVFARRGYAQATMAEIAAAAGVSTGNIYRYYENKGVLLDAVVSADFVRTFSTLLRRRVQSLGGVNDVRSLAADHLFHLASDDLLRFCVDNRLRVVILLGRCVGSRHEGFAERTVQDLIGLAVAHVRILHPRLHVPAAVRFNLQQIYRSLVGTMVTVLARFDDEKQLRAIVGGYSRYHLAGLNALFDGSLGPLTSTTRGRARRAPRKHPGR